MFKNYFKFTWRSLIKDRQFTVLNLLGLSLGLACALLIYLWVSDELQVDKFNDKDNRLYEVLKNSPDANGAVETHEHTQGLLAKSMADELPEVEYAVSVRKEDETGVLSAADKHIKAKPKFASNDFFNVFSYHLINGNKTNALSNKHGILLSDKLALKLFNTTNIIGKTVSWDHGDEFTGSYIITGVFEAPPSNATDQFDILFPYKLYVEKMAGTDGDISYWGSNSVSTYIILKKDIDAKQFNDKISGFTKTKIKLLYADKEMVKWEGDLMLQRYSDRYLYNHFENGVQSGGRIEYVKLFSIIAIFILVIACINFMNLSTAKASKRIKEIGIKKVVGASRSSLVIQYLGESVLMAFLSLIIAILIASLLLPAFKQITTKDISLQFNAGFIFSIIGIILITGLVAGSYPALYLSGFKPVVILKGKLLTSSGESWIRKGLVVFQFAISVILIVSVFVVYRQMKLIQTTNLGYNKDNIIRFANEGRLQQKLSSFLAEAKGIPGVINASDMDGDMTGRYSQGGSGINWDGKTAGKGIEFQGLDMNYDMIETLGLQLKEGRAFSKEFGSDSSSVIFNEAAIAAMGLKNPLGKTVSVWGQNKQIIGVVKDFYFNSFHEKITPFFLRFSQNNSNVFIKIKAGTEKETIAKVENLYKQYNEGLAFDYTFLDDDYQALYASEQRVAVLSRYFAGIAILISCLGLFGLAAFTAQKRQKEIGIRKVVGASVTSVVAMLSTDVLKLILIALLIAIPISWWAANLWLQGFTYRINIDAGVFIITGASVILITLLTISFQAIKAAVGNPVKSLRTE